MASEFGVFYFHTHPTHKIKSGAHDACTTDDTSIQVDLHHSKLPAKNHYLNYEPVNNALLTPLQPLYNFRTGKSSIVP